jgi:hypothetical protein
MGHVSSQSDGVSAHTALDPSPLLIPNGAFRVERVEEACNADDRLILKTVEPAYSSNGIAVVWSHKIQTPKTRRIRKLYREVTGEMTRVG